MVAAMRGMSDASSPSPMMFTLPKPSGAFRWVQLPAGPALVCDALAPFAAHFFTTRQWTLGAGSEQGVGWTEVAEAAHVPSSCLSHLRQVHGSAAVVLRTTERATEKDRCVTDEAALEAADIL